MTQYNNADELAEGFEAASTHSWPIQDAHGDHYIVTSTEGGDLFAQGLPHADEDGTNYNRNIVDDLDFRPDQYPFSALAARRPAPQPLELGADDPVGGAAMLVHTYAVHAGMLEVSDPKMPRSPVVMVDLQGFTDDLPDTLRLIFPEPLAIASRDAMTVSLEQLVTRRGSGS